ncbi:drebrin-like protein B [Watersipora subatra]|uniref:drebrin-like protein B n=1 Tax=Watersipora subatra TaxID=2589382 RepID=UPI00355AE285
MALDLKSHRDDIIKAWKDISNVDSNNTWVIYGYEGQTGVLKVVEIGDGDFEEMVDSLNAGKIQYAYCRVTDPNTSLSKFVLVNWQGDGAPDVLKGRCANHVRDVAALLRGAHLTINARDEADLDTEDVLQKVAKSSGANYSIHKEKAVKMEESSGPVGSVYKRVKPQSEIKIEERDKFWEKTELEENKRKQLELQEKRSAQQKLEAERKQRELEETRERDKKVLEHSKRVQQQRDAEQAAVRKVERSASSNSQQDIDEDENERRGRSESLRRQRAAEAKQLVQQRGNNPRDMFKQRERAASQDEGHAPPPAPKKVIRPFQAQQQPQSTQRQPSPPRQRDPTPPRPRDPTPPPRDPTPPPREPTPPPRDATPPPASTPAQSSLLHQGLPPRQDSDEEEDDQDWDAPADSGYDITPTISHHTDPPATGPSYEEEDGSMKARALYDYQATADDEVSFDPGDLITNIEVVDEGWWIGTASDGSRGLFPANYVEVI